ncbi:glycosyltransferase [Pedobacter sp. R20-19]|uniref:glycosyltransferase n=1 Tax=Pedobacter sp. R20-19 TaxID=1270196 RepID=UPI0004936BDF|nr:glycosyltransferase [Pedobacter sp. R20-19]
MNFLFISEHLPIDTYASEVVFYRHFKLLVENGHNVHILTDQNSFTNRKKDLLDQFHLHILPNRIWYYLPFKPYGILKKIRFYGYYNSYTRKIIAEQKIDKLIGFIHGNFLTTFSAYVQKKSRLPLISFFHDDTNELNFGTGAKSINNNTIEVLNASSKVLIASEVFKDNWQKFSHKFLLLYPIPAHNKKARIQTLNLTNHKIGYSGTVYNEILPALDKFSNYLARLNSDLTIIGNNEKTFQLANKYNDLTCLPLFNTAEEANEYLISNCNICLIAYPEQTIEMPWIKTCFPSKFIQYCMLDMPTIIIAPHDSAIGKWCIVNKWILYSNVYDFEIIKNLLDQVSTNSDIIKQVRYLKEEVFDPQITHKRLEEILLSE